MSFARTRLAYVLVAIIVIFWTRAANAGPFDPNGHDWEGCADFVDMARAELGKARVIVSSELDMHELHREDGVVLVHPERPLDPESLARYMRAGGRVILLDDYGTGETLLTYFGLHRVPAPSQPVETLRGNAQFAIAEPASSHPVVADVTRVVTNHPTGVKHPDLSPVLKIRAVGEPDVLVAVAGAVGQGRLLAVGDPSIVMNSMLRYPGNKTFARGLVRYAVDDDAVFMSPSDGRPGSTGALGTKRQGRLFVLVGDIAQHGSFGNEDSWLESTFNDHVRSAREGLASVNRDGFSPATLHAMSVVLGLGIVVWIGSRAGKVHKSVKPKFTRPIPAIAQGGVAGHAAVIAAPNTSRALAMMEIKSALEEDLCALLQLEQLPPHDVLVAGIASRNILDTEGIRTLKRILLRLSSIETLVLSQRAAALHPVRDREVLQVARDVKDILAKAHGSAGIAS